MRSEDVFRKPRKRAPKAERESTIQTQCWAWLRERACLVVITDAGAVNHGIPAGWPDLTGLRPDGRFLSVECKTTKGKQSEAQIAYQRWIEQLNGLYFLVHSLDELKDQWNRQEILDNSH